jgi:hypothetical protein
MTVSGSIPHHRRISGTFTASKKNNSVGIIKSYLRVSKKQIVDLTLAKDKNTVNEILISSKEGFDIDKSWQILNYLITGEKDFSEHPFTKVIHPNNYTIPISKKEEQMMDDYYENGMKDVTGQIREIEVKIELSQGFVSPTEISELVSVLKNIDIVQLVKEADFDTFNGLGIYPEIWDNSTEHKEYVQGHFNNLFAFLQRANSENDFIIVH